MAAISVEAGTEHDEVQAGCAYLRERQLPSGQFRIDVSADHENNGAAASDPTVFATSVVALNLLDLPGRDAAMVLRRAGGFLRTAMHASHVWRFWSDEHRWARVIPFDSDDTACAAMVLQAVEGSTPVPTVRALLANRGQHGLFFTWLVPHRGILPVETAFWRAALSAWRVPAQRPLFWRQTEADPNDVDAVVCANVLALLGDRQETAATSAYLAGIVRAGHEASCDKWYHRPLAFHHAVARAFAAGATSLTQVRERAIERILEHLQPGGRFGDGALDTALALCALNDWRYDGPELAPAAEWLKTRQQADGSWPAETYYTGGPKHVTRWGSPEVSTSFCVRALALGARPASPPTTAERPLVSVLIPTWERAEMVAQAIDSVLAQDYGPIEVIVVDDGSTDATPELLQDRPEIRFVTKEHAGPAAARNLALELASGEIIASLDADDLWDPDFVSAGVDALITHDLDLVFSNWIVEHEHGTLLDHALAKLALGRQPIRSRGEWCLLGPEQVRATFLDGCPAPSSSLLIRRGVIDHGWSDRLQTGDDWGLLLGTAIRRPIHAGYTVSRRWTKRRDGQNRFEGLSPGSWLTALKHDRDELRHQHWGALDRRERAGWLRRDARIRARLMLDAAIARALRQRERGSGSGPG
jgi:hypothetical protein